MKREIIERAAEDYEDGLIYSSLSEQYDVNKAFKTGAEWRINSVWHDASEVPEKKPALVEYSCFPKGYGYLVVPDLREVLGSIIRYVYIEDLIPNKENDIEK